MKENKLIRSVFLAFCLFGLEYASYAQPASGDVTLGFTSGGSSPYVFCQTSFPNGGTYTGQANFPTSAVYSVDVRFTFQRDLGGGTWSNYGASHTVTLNQSGKANVAYSKLLCPTLPDLTMVGTFPIRMQAIARYRTSPGGPIITTTLPPAQTVTYTWYQTPTVNFSLNNQAPSPGTPISHFSCTGDAFIQPSVSVSGSSISWRLRMFNSNAFGTTGTPLPVTLISCPSPGGWVNGAPPASLNITTPGIDPAYAGCTIPPFTFTNGSYYLVNLDVRNNCTTVTQTRLMRFFTTPTGQSVDFFFRGSNNADGFVSTGGSGNVGTQEGQPGAANTFSQNDGILSWGGTFTSPTWVGATATSLDVSSTGFAGGVTSWTVEVTHMAGTNPLLGTLTDPTPGNTLISLPSIPIGFGVPAVAGYFSNPVNFNTSTSGVLNKTFRVRLTGNGICGTTAVKDGFFRIIGPTGTPGQPPGNGQVWWMPIHGNGEENEEGGMAGMADEQLELSPNPTSGILNLVVDSKEETDATLCIIDLNGQQVRSFGTQVLPLFEGRNMVSTNISQLPAGTFVVQIVKPSGILVRKLIKI